MRKFLFALALIATPAYADTKPCGPNNELPDDLTPAEQWILKTAKEEADLEKQGWDEINKKRDASVGPEMRAYLHEMDRRREALEEALEVKEDVPGADTVCFGRAELPRYYRTYPRYAPYYVHRFVPRRYR